MTNVVALLLAAGKSARMGSPKALLPWGQSNLLHHQLDTLEGAGLPVLVVVGAHADAVGPSLGHRIVEICFNAEFEKGMSESIAAGVRHLMNQDNSWDAVLICAVDQPFVTPLHLENLLEVARGSDATIVQSVSKAGWAGIPVLFDSKHFSALSRLTGDNGAKAVIRENLPEVARVEAENGMLLDLDTRAQYEAFRE